MQAYFDGRWDDAVELYKRARESFQRTGNEVQTAIVTANIGELLVNQRRLDEAEPLLREAARLLRASGFVDGSAFAEIHLARVMVARKDLDAAERLLVGACDDLMGQGEAPSALEASIHLADCHLHRGNADRALAELERAEQAAGRSAALFRASSERGPRPSRSRSSVGTRRRRRL